MCSTALLAFAFAGSTAWTTPAGALTRDAADQELVDRARERAPAVIALLEKGEALAAKGSLDQAVKVFREGKAIDPYMVGLFERRECEALTALNRRDEAQNACWHELQSFRTPAGVRATVRSLVSGPSEPTFAELAQALSLVTYERARAPRNPQLAAAMCDIAESMGDAMMLQRCTEELERIAPDYEPTRRARRTLTRESPPWRFWGGWLTIAAAAALTTVHALRHLTARLSSRSRAASGVLAALVFSAALALPGVARAEGQWLSQFPIDDQDPVSSVPTPKQLKEADPLQVGYFVQDLISKAEHASKIGEHGAAIKFYEAILKLVPNRAVTLVKMCDEFEAMGNLTQAVNACGLALALDGVTIGDYAHFVHLMLGKEGPLSDKEMLALANVINHMKQDSAGRIEGSELECEVASRTSDVAKLRECTAVLVQATPNDSKILLFQWDLAVRQHDFTSARELLARAKTAGIAGDRLQRMEHATYQAEHRRHWMFGLMALGAIILLACLVYAVVAFRRRSPPAPPAPEAAPAG
jgi:tetratricopeptide (TPR) repeat protein